MIGLSWLAFFTSHHLYPNFNLHYLAYAVGFSGVAIVWLTEIFMPYRKSWLINQDDFGSDLLFTNIILPLLSKVAETFLSFLIIFFLSENTRGSLSRIWPSHWPLLFQLVLMLIICELPFYWFHRIAHTWTPLWNFHSIHHSVKRVYWNNSGRFHPVDLFFNWFLYFSPLFIFGVSEELIALFLITNGITGLMEHSNIDFKVGHLNRFFNSAELHRWHHSLEHHESNSNYGKVLSIWDQVFGTFYYNDERDVGGVGVRGDRVPMTFWKQIVYPFKVLFKIN